MVLKVGWGGGEWRCLHFTILYQYFDRYAPHIDFLLALESSLVMSVSWLEEGYFGVMFVLGKGGGNNFNGLELLVLIFLGAYLIVGNVCLA